MKNKCPFCIVFQVLKVLLTKICKIQPPDLLFIVVFISFYIRRYHFSQMFRTSFIIILKKIFVMNFPFLTDSLNPLPHPLNGQNQRVFCQCSLIGLLSSPNKHFFKVGLSPSRKFLPN